jgi:hypothetical protein
MATAKAHASITPTINAVLNFNILILQKSPNQATCALKAVKQQEITVWNYAGLDMK